MEDGFKFIFTKEGFLKLLVMAFSCTTFALLAASNAYKWSTALEWVLAAFIIAFAISFLFYFFRVLGLSKHMQCGGGPCSYDGFDFVWSWFCTIWCFAAAITFAVNYPKGASGEVIGSIVLAFCTFVVYAIEAFILRIYAPANIGFVATKHGWIKTALVFFGAATFGLMVDSGYPWDQGDKGVYSGTTYALVAFTVSWSVTTLMWIAHLAGPKGSIEGSENFKKGEMVWAVVGVLLFWSGAACFAAYMNCKGDDFENEPKCQKRLSGVIAGFVTGILYLIELFILR